MHESSQQPLSLDQLRAACPGYQIDRDPRRDPPRYVATARDLTASLSCVVTTDLGELAACLTAAADTSGLAGLRRACPGWVITSGWVAAGSGPDRRVLIASRDGDTLTALDAAGLAAKITAAGRAR